MSIQPSWPFLSSPRTLSPAGHLSNGFAVTSFLTQQLLTPSSSSCDRHVFIVTFAHTLKDRVRADEDANSWPLYRRSRKPLKSVTWESYTNAVDASERWFELFYHVHKRISSQSVDIVKFASSSMKHFTDVPREIGPELVGMRFSPASSKRRSRLHKMMGYHHCYCVWLLPWPSGLCARWKHPSASLNLLCGKVDALRTIRKARTWLLISVSTITKWFLGLSLAKSATESSAIASWSSFGTRLFPRTLQDVVERH